MAAIPGGEQYDFSLRRLGEIAEANVFEVGTAVNPRKIDAVRARLANSSITSKPVTMVERQYIDALLGYANGKLGGDFDTLLMLEKAIKNTAKVILSNKKSDKNTDVTELQEQCKAMAKKLHQAANKLVIDHELKKIEGYFAYFDDESAGANEKELLEMKGQLLEIINKELLHGQPAPTPIRKAIDDKMYSIDVRIQAQRYKEPRARDQLFKTNIEACGKMSDAALVTILEKGTEMLRAKKEMTKEDEARTTAAAAILRDRFIHNFHRYFERSGDKLVTKQLDSVEVLQEYERVTGQHVVIDRSAALHHLERGPTKFEEFG